MLLALLTFLAVGATVPDTTAIPAPAPATHGIAVEVRAGAAMGDFGGYGARDEFVIDTSWRIQAGYAWRMLEVTLGYGQISFGCRGGLCSPTELSYTSAGFDFGTRARLGAFWVQAGVMSHSLDVRWSPSDGDDAQTTADGQTGLMFALGFEIGLYRDLALVWGVGAAGYSATLPGAPHTDRVRLVGSDLGLRYRIPIAR